MRTPPPIPTPLLQLTQPPNSTVILSIVRIKYLKLFEDFPWQNVAPSLWSIGELTSAITCACLVTLRPFVARYFPGLASIIGRTSNKPSNAKVSEGYSRSRRRNDVETGHPMSKAKRLPSVDGSQVELASADRSTAKVAPHPYEAHYSGRVSEDVGSLGSNNSDLGLSARGPGVGVRTSISPAQPEQVHRHPGNGRGVQVQRELRQVRS